MRDSWQWRGNTYTLLITASVLAAFFMMFRRIVNRYCGRIASLPAKVKIWQTFPARGWILIVFMMGLGITLNHIPEIPSAFTASFYSGLGPMLVVSAFRFISQTHKCPWNGNLVLSFKKQSVFRRRCPFLLIPCCYHVSSRKKLAVFKRRFSQLMELIAF